MAGNDDDTLFEEFRSEWIAEVTAGDPHTLELGRRFARKLITQWLDIDPDAPDLIHCDGSGDGGIDLAYLARSEPAERDEAVEAVEGDTWYLVQSKYGSALAGVATVLGEGQKVIDTLDGRRPRLSSLAEGLLDRLTAFRARMSPQDRILLVLATERPLTDAERRALQDVRAMGQQRIGSGFDVEEVSVETIFRRQQAAADPTVRVALRAELVHATDDLLVGAVHLPDLYAFLKGYQAATHDLDRLYERNVRQFLGSKRKINKGIQTTLIKSPERFGLYNNGITIVAGAFTEKGDGVWELVEPHVVNGCQTTRSLWEVLHPRMEAGGTGQDPEFDAWRGRLNRGVAVIKVVRVGPGADAQIADITRYTNSQNAVRDKDFIALEGDFQQWQAAMAARYGIYLEIQRGGWDSRRAWQRQHPTERQYAVAANAFDLVKVYGAGWMSEPGTAFGRNRAFVPDGTVFRKIMQPPATGEPFGLDDLYAAFQLQRAADNAKFGRGATQSSRRQSKYLFYFVVIELLRDTLRFTGRPTATYADITRAILELSKDLNADTWRELTDEALRVIDEYMTQGPDSVFQEPAFVNTFNNDLNAFLKWDALGKGDDATPGLRALIAFARRALGRGNGGSPSCRDRVATAIGASK